MSHILVTGASGQLGKSIRKLATSYPSFTFHFANKADLDICNEEKVNSVFESGNFDYCINCAAYTNVERSEKTPETAFEVNEKGVANLAANSKRAGVVLIHISTDYVFDGSKEEGYRPDDLPNPINVYGRSKWEGEKRIQETLDQYFIIRTSWLYNEEDNNFYTKIKNKAEKRETIFVTTEQRGRPTHSDNLARYILDLIADENKSFGIHHFTDGVTMTWFEFAEKILKENGMLHVADLRASEDHPSLAKRPAYSILIA